MKYLLLNASKVIKYYFEVKLKTIAEVSVIRHTRISLFKLDNRNKASLCYFLSFKGNGKPWNELAFHVAPNKICQLIIIFLKNCSYNGLKEILI